MFIFAIEDELKTLLNYKKTKPLTPMKQFKNWIPACILFSLMLSLTSCQGLIDAILGDHADNSSSSSGGGGTTPTAQKKTAEIKIEVSKIYIWNGDETERALTTNSDGAITVTSSDEASVTVTYNQTKGTMTIKFDSDAQMEQFLKALDAR